MRLNAYAKVNMILNVLGTLPNGYHQVEMLMQAISLCDIVTVDFTEPENTRLSYILGPKDFEYGRSDLAYRAAMLMAEQFRPDLTCSTVDSDGLELAAGLLGVRISTEKHIPAAAGLAGGSSDAAAVMVGLARLWGICDNSPGSVSSGLSRSESACYIDPNPCKELDFTDCSNNSEDSKSLNSALSKQKIYISEYSQSNAENKRPKPTEDDLINMLLPLGAKLGSDVPFCIAAQLGHPAAIARGTGTELEFVEPADCGIDLFFSEKTIPNKTAAVYKELKNEDCQPYYDIDAFLAAETIEEKRACMGNHLQPAAERLFKNAAENDSIGLPGKENTKNGAARKPFITAADTGSAELPSKEIAGAILCGAGPTYFTIGETGIYRTVL